MDALRSLAHKHEGRSAEPTAAAIDSQSVQTTEMCGPVGYDACKRVKGKEAPYHGGFGGVPDCDRDSGGTVQAERDKNAVGSHHLTDFSYLKLIRARQVGEGSQGGVCRTS